MLIIREHYLLLLEVHHKVLECETHCNPSEVNSRAHAHLQYRAHDTLNLGINGPHHSFHDNYFNYSTMLIAEIYGEAMTQAQQVQQTSVWPMTTFSKIMLICIIIIPFKVIIDNSAIESDTCLQ